MKKISSNTALVALVLGALMVLYALGFISGGGAATVIGIFGLLFGLAYIFIFVLSILNLKNDNLDLVKGLISLGAFPLFLFVYYLCILINAYNAFTVTNWIIVLLVLITALGSAILGILSLVLKENKIKKFLDLVVICFIGLLIVLLVFPIGNFAAALGDLSLVDIFFIVCFFLVTKPYVDLPTTEAKNEETKEEEVKDAPVEEEKVEEEKDEPKEEVQTAE